MLGDAVVFAMSLTCAVCMREVVEKDCQACKLNKEDARDCSRRRKLIKDV